MNRTYDLLHNVLTQIEDGLKNGISPAVIAHRLEISTMHLHRLFKFAFNQTIGAYIRSRKLAASIYDLVNTDLNIISIALDYDFEFEQSYIRSFKREFGITPGDLRKSGHVVKIKPPIHLFDENKFGDGLLFGPEIVMVPKFHVIGKQYDVPFHDTLIAQKAAIDFWENEKNKINSAVNPNVYIGMTKDGKNKDDKISIYLPSLQVSSLDHIPEGFNSYTFSTSLCARFRYIGQHHYYEINGNTASSMYYAIHNFANDEQAKYALAVNKVYFEKIDTSIYDGTFCQMEWFTPVVKK